MDRAGRKLFWFVALTILTSSQLWAQDAKLVVRNAQKAIGDPGSIQYSGTGKMGGLGQSFSPTGDWHTTIVTSYRRTIDYSSRSSKEELTRTQENPPDRGGEVPFDGEQKQVNLVSGDYAWNQPGAAPQPAIASADERQLQIWLTPHGFLRAAAENQIAAKSQATEGCRNDQDQRGRFGDLVDRHVVQGELFATGPVAMINSSRSRERKTVNSAPIEDLKRWRR